MTAIDLPDVGPRDRWGAKLNDAITTVAGDVAAETTARAAAVAAEAAARAAADTAEVARANGAYPTFAAALKPVVQRQRAPQIKKITNWESGHGWTSIAGGNTINLNDTSDFVAGSGGGTGQCASVVTAGTAAFGFMRKVSISPALDLSASDMVLWLKFTNVDKLNQIQLTLNVGGFSSPTTSYQGTIYDATIHVAAQEVMKDGVWIPFRFNPKLLMALQSGAASLAAIDTIQIGVKDDGTGTAVTVKFGGFGYYPRSTVLGTTGVYSLRFDDCYGSWWTEVVPYLAKYGIRATFAVIWDRVGVGSNITLDQLLFMQNQLGHEIAPHALTQANHDLTNGFADLSLAAYEAEVAGCKAALNAAGLGSGADVMVYPKGIANFTMDPITSRYSGIAQTTNRAPMEVLQPGLPLHARANSFDSFGTALATVTGATTGWIDQAYNSNSWLTIIVHDVLNTASPTAGQTKRTDFQAIVDAIVAKGAPILPVGDVWRAFA